MAATMDLSFCWDAECESELIDEVFEKRFLWDIKNPLYTKKNYKRVTYEEIGENLKRRWPEKSQLFTVDSLIRKFAKMKSYYLKEARKWRMLRSGSEGMGIQPKWTHFSRLSFLDDVVTPEDSVSSLNNSLLTSISISDSEYVHENGIEAADVNGESQKSHFEHSQTPQQTTKKSQKRKKLINSEDALQQAVIFLQNLQDRDGKEDAFASYLSSELKEIEDPLDRDLARFEIHKIILKFKYKNKQIDIQDV